MNRRTFVRRSVIGGVGLASVNAPAAFGREETKPETSRITNPPLAFELDELTIAELQSGMASGKYSAHSLAKKYLDRIDDIDKHGPAINSVIELNPDALSIAGDLDRERKAGRVRGPLHGVPVLIKDNIDTHDRMTTTAGSLALGGSIPLQDSFVAKKLRDAGAVILGKTNLSEWANFRSSHSSSGWSGRGGQTKNPYVLDRNPCGSSSGTGAAIAANLAAAGVGTETDGSVVCPSGANSLVGIKPTLGLISRAGIIPIAHSQDTAGPMCRTVADAATLLGVLAGMDARDPVTQESQGKSEGNYVRFLDPNGLQGARIGVARAKYFGYSPDVDRLCEQAIAVMKAQGAQIVDPADIPHAEEYGDTESIVLKYEFKADLNAYLAELTSANVRTLADVIAFNQAHQAEEMPYFGQELFEQSQKQGPLSDYLYIEALAHNHRMSRTEGLDAVLADKKLDAIVAPTGNPSWPTDFVNGDHFTGGSSTPAAVAGYPSITV